MNTTTNMAHVNEAGFRKEIEANIKESKLRLEWFNKLCDFITENYPQGVKISKHVQNKLDKVFGAGVVRLVNGIVCHEFQIEGIGSCFYISYVGKSYPTANQDMLLLEEFEKQNGSMVDYVAYIEKKEKALQELPELVSKYNAMMDSLTAFNSLVPDVYPFGRFKISIEEKKDYTK